jgi:hypothetical protein
MEDAMAVIGMIDAELRGAKEYKTGGLPPFRRTRVRGPFPVHEFLERACRALEKLGVTSVVSLFVDELAVYQEPEGKEANLEDVLALARGKSSDMEAATSFHIMLMHADEDLTHVISMEGSIDHVVEAPAISVVDIARSATEEEDEGAESDASAVEVSAGEALEPSEVEYEEVEYEEPEDEVRSEDEVRMDAFLERLVRELDRELALDEPETEVRLDP